jgi:hypothetical protein
VTARRATNQIVLATAAQVLAEVATLVAAAALVAATRTDARRADPPVAPRVDLMVRARVPEQIARVAMVLPRIVRAAMATAPTVLVRVVTATRAHVARATALVGHRVRRPIDRILRALRGMAIRVHDARVTDRILRARRGMAIRVLVGTATAPIPHAHRVTVRVQTVLEATVQTVLAQTGRAAFDPTAIDLAATGSPRAVNDVRSARR